MTGTRIYFVLPLVLLALIASCQPKFSWGDDTPMLADLLAPAVANGGVVTIPAGDYAVDGTKTLPVPSNTTVFAYGARFHLPQRLGDKARFVLFEGADVANFTWLGGEFLGHVFDPAARENSWEPNANARIFVINTTRDGETHDINFRDVRSDGLAGAVLGVHGQPKSGSDRNVEAYALRVHVENCTLLRSGKFMWDYGYLWHQLVWPEEFEPWEVARAEKYFRNDLVRTDVKMADGDDHVRFDNRKKTLPVDKAPAGDSAARPAGESALCFFGGTLPQNVVRGRQYFVVESSADYVKISEEQGGAPLRFARTSGPDVKLIHNMRAAFGSLYAPIGNGPGKGAVDITCAKDVRITGCQLSALGDTMHVQRCQNVVFANNHILGSRMGAFFLAEFCKNATITGNLVDGTNGSRVMSVEKSCEDVTITGNVFRNGGRGSWINQPKNLILCNNIFINNTTKGEDDRRRGRRHYRTGEPERFPELYFTIHEENGAYGPVIVRDNLFVCGSAVAAEAISFAPNGRGLQVTGNNLQTSGSSSAPATIGVDPSCRDIVIRDNTGAELKQYAIHPRNGGNR